MKSFVKEAARRTRNQVGNGRIVLGLSGGVDSSVAALLLHKAIGKQLICIFVDNGLLRSGERGQIKETFGRHFHINVRYVDASKQFLTALRGVTEPEQKRKIIGREFVRVFEVEAKKLRGVAFLAQGTLYPDVIESVSAWGGPSATIKTHHNVGGLPKRMHLKLVEPLRDLFKDEVRELGKLLGLADELLWRHPFPGPGLAVRVLGEVTEERLRIVREADERVVKEIRRAGLYRNLWQAFAVLLPVKTVGVMGELDSLIVLGHPHADPQTQAAHACGHHCQIGMMLGVASGLKAAGVLEHLSGRVALLAVPAEEYIEIEYRDELRRAGEDDSHTRLQSRISSRDFFSILVLMRSRLSGLRYSTNTLPRRWSISCCTHTDSRPSASNCWVSPDRSSARTVTRAWRDTLS